MHFVSFAAALAASNLLLRVSASPLVAKRQASSSSSSSAQPSVGLIATTLSDGTPTTLLVAAPQPTGASKSGPATGPASATASSPEASPTSYTFSRTGLPIPASTNFPRCHDTSARPFCLPNNGSTLYAGDTYYATWNPDLFAANSSITVRIQSSNDSTKEVWSSPQTDNSMGFVAVPVDKAWMQGYDQFNLTFYAVNFEANDPSKKATPYEGPRVTVSNAPAKHYEPPQPNKLNKEGLLIGLPVGLGALVFVIIGLYFGMRKHRSIDVAGIVKGLGHRRKGYGVGKSKSQRLGLSKKGAIRLEERQAPRSQYRDAPRHARDESLGSLADDDDEIRPAPRGNQFRDEIDRQRTGR